MNQNAKIDKFLEETKEIRKYYENIDIEKEKEEINNLIDTMNEKLGKVDDDETRENIIEVTKFLIERHRNLIIEFEKSRIRTLEICQYMESFSNEIKGLIKKALKEKFDIDLNL